MTFVRVTLIAVCWFRAFCTSRLWSFGASRVGCGPLVPVGCGPLVPFCGLVAPVAPDGFGPFVPVGLPV